MNSDDHQAIELAEIILFHLSGETSVLEFENQINAFVDKQPDIFAFKMLLQYTLYTKMKHIFAKTKSGKRDIDYITMAVELVLYFKRKRKHTTTSTYIQHTPKRPRIPSL